MFDIDMGMEFQCFNETIEFSTEIGTVQTMVLFTRHAVLHIAVLSFMLIRAWDSVSVHLMHGEWDSSLSKVFSVWCDFVSRKQCLDACIRKV